MSGKLMAFYMRLSIEDGDLKTTSGKTESNSIANQRKLLLDYYKNHPELHQYEIAEFFDDGFSGTNFNRPRFAAMMELVREREIGCIVVKDLSRFGREYLEVGGYLELILPLFGTRFISVNDAFDSNDYLGTTGGLELALHNLINGMYSQDLSVKVRTAIKTRSRRGEYWGGPTFYGYLHDPNNKHKLVVDEQVRDNITEIYRLCIAGKSTQDIAKHLNQLGILCPAEYKKRRGVLYNGSVMEGTPIWIGGTVRKILTDERYTGKMISNTRECVGIRTGKMRSLPQDEWIIVKNTHEAIVSEETFRQAALALTARMKTRNENTSGDRRHNLFVCGYCGRKLQKSQGKQIHMFCMKARSQNNVDCSRIHENLDELQKQALAVVKKLSAVLVEKEKLIKKHDGSQESAIRSSISAMELRLQQLSNSKLTLYEEYRSGRLSAQKFKNIQEKNGLEVDRLTRLIKDAQLELAGRMKQIEQLGQTAAQSEQISVLTEYRPEVICKLVEKIRVFDGGRMEIELYNEDFLLPLLSKTELIPDEAC